MSLPPLAVKTWPELEYVYGSHR